MRQFCPAAQSLPQVPQFFTGASKPMHSMASIRQGLAQVPSEQHSPGSPNMPCGQTVPPQLQEPAEQVSGLVQWLPQEPQLLLSVVVFTQAPPQHD
jgi:hypothetical protein